MSKRVFHSLQEVFPQVDLRILKAVAIEHSTDVDAAVEFVLFEVLPSLDKSVESSETVNDTVGSKKLPSDIVMQDAFPTHQGTEEENTDLLPGSSVASENDPYPYAYHSSASNLSLTIDRFDNYFNCEEEEPNLLLHRPAGQDVFSFLPSEQTSDFHVKPPILHDAVTATSSNVYVNQLICDEEPVAVTPNAPVDKPVCNKHFEDQFTAMENISLPLESVEGNSYDGLHGTRATVNVLADYPSLRDFPFSKKMPDSPTECEDPISRFSLKNDTNTLSELDFTNFLHMTSSQEIPSYVSGDALSKECGAPSYSDHSCLRDSEEQHSRKTSENGSPSVAYESDKSAVTEKTTVSGTQSGRVVNMDILEDFMSDSISNKESLVFAYESVCNMMKDVELQEEKAKQAKDEASKAGHEIFAKAEGMKEMLKHAREAKEMQAGEVYGEKSILATEARELQSRLLNLSDEREKSLSIVDEIHRILEARLAAAKEEQAAAEEEQLEREEAARKILNEQEVFMEEIVKESEKLQQAAEENAKLREFLMDRGRIVDMLQGEMTVICEDVMRLKERVDGRVPLSKRLPVTSCSSVSSSSSSSNFRGLSERILHIVELGDLGQSTGTIGDTPRNVPLLEPQRAGTTLDTPTNEQQLVHNVDDNIEINANDNINRVPSDDDWEMF